jgi:multidrug efflux pump subunit AcrA (membrane-fusion protein)
MTPPSAVAIRPPLFGAVLITSRLPLHGDAHITLPRRADARSAILRRWGLLCAGALLAGALLDCGGAATQEVETVDKVPVVTRPAVRGTIRPLVVASGTVRPAAGAELLVTAPQTARIAEMPRGVGDAVAKGALLVRFDIPSLAVDASDRRSALASAEARLTNARAAAERIRGLFQRGIAARKELEDAERELADAEASLAAARTAREASGELAARAVVRAPFSGVVAAPTTPATWSTLRRPSPSCAWWIPAGCKSKRPWRSPTSPR